jgi:hypothetical protein
MGLLKFVEEVWVGVSSAGCWCAISFSGNALLILVSWLEIGALDNLYLLRAFAIQCEPCQAS